MSVVKKMSGAFSITAFVALTAVAGWSCGEEDEGGEPDSGTPGGQQGGGDGGAAGGTGCTDVRPDRTLTLIQVLGADESAFISAPHKVQTLKPDGTQFDPPNTAMSNNTGKFTLKGLPCDQGGWIHVIGSGTTDADTYDSLSLSAPDSGDNLIRISTVGTVATAETTGGFKSDMSKVAIGGAVYSVDSTGKRRPGGIGCAKVYVDGEAHPLEGVDQRYVSGVLPTTWANLQETQRSGKFYIGNISKGKHKFMVKIGDGDWADLRQQ